MHKLTELVQTCTACPAQWEGKTDDGQYVYIRYRWGILRAGVGPTIHEAVMADSPSLEAVRKVAQKYGDSLPSDLENHRGVCIFHEDVGDTFDGFLTLGELIEHLKNVLDFNDVSKGEK